MINKKTYMKKWREENKEKIKAYRKEYQKSYYPKNREKIINMSRKYEEDNKKNKTKYRQEYYLKNKQSFVERNKKVKELFPDKIKARNKARKIKIPNGQLCEFCYKNKAIEKHHEDYKKPLQVLFLCGSCHAKEHHPIQFNYSEIKKFIKDLGLMELYNLDKVVYKEIVKRANKLKFYKDERRNKK